MKLGVAFQEGVNGTDEAIIERVREYARRWDYAPAAVAVWRRIDQGPPSFHLTETLRVFGSRTVVFLETSWIPNAHARLQAGEWDEALQAYRGRGLILRFNQEMNGRKFPWSGRPAEYIEDFRYVGAQTEGRMFWCPMLHSATNMTTAPRYYPGDEHTDIVGFDRYVRSKHPLTPIPKAWDKAITLLDRIAPGKPKWVGEFGAEDDGRPRGGWLGTGAWEKRVEVGLYFDLDLSGVPGERVSWKMDSRMHLAAAMYP